MQKSEQRSQEEDEGSKESYRDSTFEVKLLFLFFSLLAFLLACFSLPPVNYGKKSCVALPAHPFIQPTILSLALADSHLALMSVHTLITSSDSHADIEEISF